MIKEFFSNPKINADWIGLRMVKENTTSLTVRDGNCEPLNRVWDEGHMVEVFCNGYMGYAASSENSLAGLQNAAKIAYDRAQLAQKYSLYKFDVDKIRPKQKGEFYSDFQQSLDSLSVGEIFDRLLACHSDLKSADSIISTYGAAILVDHETRVYSSDGSEILQKHQFITSDFSSTAKSGQEIQTRTDTLALQTGLELLEKEKLKARASKVGCEVLELLEAEECPSLATNLVLDPGQMMLQIHESIGHPLELDRILGDERNYAGWSFINLEDFGKLQYGSDLLNIVFDPTVKNEFATYLYDDIGNKATKEYIIEKGLLKRGLGSLESQVRTGLDGVANQRASSWNRPSVDRMANINLEPGDKNFDQIISETESGVYMETNRSWSIDDFRNKFQFGCEYAKLIENGKLTKTLKNPNYRGVSTAFWNSLAAVGDQSTLGVHGTMWCGKAEPNQAIRVGHASPVCKFENIEIFGGAG